MRLICVILLMHIKQLLITVSRVFSCVNQTYIDPTLLSHSHIITSRDLNTTECRVMVMTDESIDPPTYVVRSSLYIDRGHK